MNEMDPRGADIEIYGIHRNLIFSTRAVNNVQSLYGMSVFEVLDTMLNDREQQLSMTSNVLAILLEAEAYKAKVIDQTELRVFTVEEVESLVDIFNVIDIIVCIYQAYGISIPEADPEEDVDPKRMGGSMN